MAGCESCEQNLMAEMESEDEEELGEQAQKVLEGEEEAPWAYGPLSDWDGPYCKFCHGVGQVLSFLIFATVIVGAFWLNIQFLYAITFGFLVYIPLAVSVGYIGRFPLFGALVGPYVEWAAASFFNVCLTEKAKKEYNCGSPSSGYQAATDGGEEKVFSKHGTEMHVVATPWAVEQCADPTTSGALERIEVENTPAGPKIRDRHNFDAEVNKFENIKFHVDPSRPTVCHTPDQRLMTTLQFTDLIRSQGQGGIE